LNFVISLSAGVVLKVRNGHTPEDQFHNLPSKKGTNVVPFFASVLLIFPTLRSAGIPDQK
jgi:hypothetical protein